MSIWAWVIECVGGGGAGGEASVGVGEECVGGGGGEVSLGMGEECVGCATHSAPLLGTDCLPYS